MNLTHAAAIIRAKSDMWTPVEWRRFADRLEIQRLSPQGKCSFCGRERAINKKGLMRPLRPRWSYGTSMYHLFIPSSLVTGKAV